MLLSLFACEPFNLFVLKIFVRDLVLNYRTLSNMIMYLWDCICSDIYMDKKI